MSRLEELYDPATLRAIDAAPTPSPGARDTVGGARGTLAAGALVAAGLVGVREALDERADDAAIVEVRLDPGLDADAAVTVFFVPDAPAASVAVVRPWLLGFRAVPGIPGPVIPRP